MSDPRTRIEVPEGQAVVAPLFGPQDAHRRLLEKRLGVRVRLRRGHLELEGAPERAEFAEHVLRDLLARVRAGQPVFLKDVEQTISLVDDVAATELPGLYSSSVFVTTDRRKIQPKSPNQKIYLDALDSSDLVFSVGPAGTGKTYLAMAAAVSALKRGAVQRIILTRPAVEAGERLGFLPGSLVEKVNPYLRPVYDALFDLVGIEQSQRLMDSNTVEVAPLAFMRGRTLNQAFVILDEAQNTTKDQMKMFLTRLGYASRAVVTGDVTQVDLPRDKESGLAHAVRVLEGIEDISIVRLTPVDVVRHKLVRAIVEAYDRDDA